MSAEEIALRKKIVSDAGIIVVKVGTNALSKADDTLDVSRIEALAEQIHLVRKSGKQLVLVSSGAVGSGMGLMGLTRRPEDLSQLQAAAAVGQAHLIGHYDDCFRKYGYHAAQMLLTANDFRHRVRYLNVRNTIHALFDWNCIPVINENDTVSVGEIKFGDNDRLAALVAGLLDSPLLVLLSVIEGLYSGDPKAPESKFISLVPSFTPEIDAMAQDVRSSRGTGGMKSKLLAAKSATAVGHPVIIANGLRPRVLEEILEGKPIGTLFLPQGEHLPAWKRWIGYNVAPSGRLVVDDGACTAVRTSGKSLLAIGIREIQGDFEKGQVVSLIDLQGREFARGLSNYNSGEVRKIAGKKGDQIRAILGMIPYSEVIHRDNLVVIPT